MTTIDIDKKTAAITDRAQSEVVGVALLVGVFALLATLVGVVVIGNVTEQASDEPLVNLNVSATADELVLVHGGGDALDVDEVTVLVRQDGDETRYDLSNFNETRESDSGQFSPGKRWQRNHSRSAGTARVLVAHGPSNAVIFDETITVPRSDRQ